MLETTATIARQYIDAVTVFEALEEAQQDAAQVRGGMYWHAGSPSAPQAKYLVRTTPAGAETSLGARTLETEAIYERFTKRRACRRTESGPGTAPSPEPRLARRAG